MGGDCSQIPQEKENFHQLRNTVTHSRQRTHITQFALLKNLTVPSEIRHKKAFPAFWISPCKCILCPLPTLHSSGATQRQILTCWTSQPVCPPCRAHCSRRGGNSSERLQVRAAPTFQRKPPWPRAQLSTGAAAPVHTSARLLDRSQLTGDIGALHVTLPGPGRSLWRCGIQPENRNSPSAELGGDTVNTPGSPFALHCLQSPTRPLLPLTAGT